MGYLGFLDFGLVVVDVLCVALLLLAAVLHCKQVGSVVLVSPGLRLSHDGEGGEVGRAAPGCAVDPNVKLPSVFWNKNFWVTFSFWIFYL